MPHHIDRVAKYCRNVLINRNPGRATTLRGAIPFSHSTTLQSPHSVRHVPSRSREAPLLSADVASQRAPEPTVETDTRPAPSRNAPTQHAVRADLPFRTIT